MFQLPVSGLHLVAYDRKRHTWAISSKERMGGSSSSNGRKYLGGNTSHKDACHEEWALQSGLLMAISVSPPRPLSPSVERLKKEQTPHRPTYTSLLPDCVQGLP